MTQPRFHLLCALAVVVAGVQMLRAASGEDLPATLPKLQYHLTARPLLPLDVERDDYLDAVEGLCRYLASLQDERGAIIDPYLNREHQYATPYFAHPVGVLLDAERGSDLKSAGIAAMEHATRCLATGSGGIPDRHGEFFIAPLCEALELYRPHVDDETWQTWHRRLQTPLAEILENQHGRINNWRTYAMKGEWLRARAGLVPRDAAVAFIEDAWLRRTQRARIASDKWSLYQDWSSDPQSHAVEAVGRGNLLALVAAGYDGPHAAQIASLVERGGSAALLWQDPSGQCPPNGRTDDHVFNDVLYQLICEVMAEQAHARGEEEAAGQFRRAAALSFRSIERWRRTAGPQRGSYFVTKNHFDPGMRVGYQPASQVTNYNGAVAYHLAEAYRARKSDIAERPAPTEIGGYVIEADARFSSAVANAGGMQVVANLRGDTVPKYGRFWTPLGIVRFARAGWDSRLGPSDGAHDAASGQAVSFAPTWREGDRWVRLAERASDYRGTLHTEFVHPLLVRMTILYHTVTGSGGPTFRHELVITPDGLLTTLTCNEPREFGLTIPVLVDDGRPLDVTRSERRIAVAYPVESSPSGDQQNYLLLNANSQTHTGKVIRSAVGDLQPLRVSGGESIRVFVYPRSAGDPTADEVLASFHATGSGFTSVLGTVNGDLYRGRTAAGGLARQLDLDGDGRPDFRFNQTCGSIVQLREGKPTRIEVDRAVTAKLEERERKLEPYRPRTLLGDEAD